jgi:general stress protein YciG
MTVSEAGRAGGKKTAATHGAEFYRAIGREGGKKSGKRRSKAEEVATPVLYPNGRSGPDK